MIYTNNSQQILIYKIPKEIIRDEIFSNLSDKELLLTITLVCKEFLEITNEDYIWKKRILKFVKPSIADQFFQTFNGWKLAYCHCKEMSKRGEILSPTEIIDFNNVKRSGKFLHGKLEGEATVSFANKTYKAKFKNGKIADPITKTLYDGKVAIGFFKDCLTGEGTITHPSGKIEEGFFYKGKLHGNGIRKLPSGEVLEGRFCSGFLSASAKSRETKAKECS